MAIPSIVDLYNSIISDLEGELGVTISIKMKVYLRALAAVQAAKLKLFYISNAKVQKNIFVDTADPESTGGTLERFGRVKLGRDPFKATAGVYTIVVLGDIGGFIPAGTTYKSNDDSLNPGYLFVVDADKTLIATTDFLSIRALTTGLDSLLELGDNLTVTAPLAQVDSNAQVLAVTTVPLAAEAIEDYREKAIEAYQLEPQGGAASDYRIWAADAQGVKKVYPFAKDGFIGEVNLFIEATIVDSIDGKGTPTPVIIADVESVVEMDPDATKPLNERGRRPISAFEIHFEAVTPKDVDITINGSGTISAGTQTKINSSFESELALIRPFVGGADDPTKMNDMLTNNFLISLIQDALEPGETFSSVNLQVDSISVNSYQFLNGDIPYKNNVNFVS